MLRNSCFTKPTANKNKSLKGLPRKIKKEFPAAENPLNNPYHYFNFLFLPRLS